MYIYFVKKSMSNIFRIRLIAYNIIIPIIFMRSLLYKLYSKIFLKKSHIRHYKIFNILIVYTTQSNFIHILYVLYSMLYL